MTTKFSLLPLNLDMVLGNLTPGEFGKLSELELSR